MSFRMIESLYRYKNVCILIKRPNETCGLDSEKLLITSFNTVYTYSGIVLPIVLGLLG